MKKVLLACAAIALLSLCSCSKYKDCQCTYSVLGFTHQEVVTAAQLEEMEQTCSEWEAYQASIGASIECVEM